MKKINSLQIIRRFSFEEWGGTETVVWNTSQKLIEKGFDTEIVATNALSKTKEEIVNNVPTKRFNYFYPYLNLKRSNLSVLDKKGGNPYSRPLYNYLVSSKGIDIFHCHTMQRIANTVRRAAKKKKIPYIVSFHGGFFDVPKSEMEEMMKPLEGTFNYGKIYDIIYKNNRFLDDAAGIICVGHNEYLITKDKYPDKLVEYLPNGVDINKFKQDINNDFRQKHNIPAEREVIICISRIDYQKNQGMLVDLLNAQQNKNLHLVLIGPVTSQKYYDKTREKIDKYKLKDNITMIKGLKATDPDLVNAYNSADYFILPSIHEPFGIVALEAWASRLPVIAAKVGGLKKLITENETVLFFSDNSLDDLIEKFNRLKNEKELRNQLIENAYKEVISTYSWDIITDKLTEFYEKIIKKYHRNGS